MDKPESDAPQAANAPAVPAHFATEARVGPMGDNTLLAVYGIDSAGNMTPVSACVLNKEMLQQLTGLLVQRYNALSREAKEAAPRIIAPDAARMN